MTAHSLATAVIDFSSEHIPDVEERIEALGNPAIPVVRARLDASAIIHFVSMSVVKISERRAVILIELSADGSDEAALDALSDALPDELLAIFDAAALDVPYDRRRWLRERRIRLGQGFFSTCGLAFDGSPAMSVARIKREACLAYWAETELKKLYGSTSPARKLTLIRQQMWKGEKTDKWAFVPQPCPMLRPSPPRDSVWDRARIGRKLLIQLLVWPYCSPLSSYSCQAAPCSTE